MKKHSSLRRFLAVCLALAMILSLMPGAAVAAGTDGGSVSFEEVDSSRVSIDLRGNGGIKAGKIDLDSGSSFESTDRVRVLIVMAGEAAISMVEEGLKASDAQVAAYRENLRLTQEYAAEAISEEALGGDPLDVVWNLTLAVNAISANVEYGQIEDIAKVSGVKAVYIERRYDPMPAGGADLNNIPAQNTTGAAALKLDGYTGAGMRIAVIDTGTAQYHQSFDEGAFEYSLEQQAREKGMSPAEYRESLHLLTREEIAGKLTQLNVYKRDPGWYDAGDLYISSKLPFGYNYIDDTTNISHIAGFDENGYAVYEEHGSHVAGIAAANSYIPNGSGGYVDAAAAVGVTGVAPDAQIITMKVFGANGGAYTSDNFAAIEDAMVLDCDVVNLSLGSSGGFVTARGEYRFVNGEPDDANDPTSIDGWIDSVMDRITEDGIIMCVSAGNSGNWAEGDNYESVIDPPYCYTTSGKGMMYTDEGGTYNVSSPSTFHNTMSVASADNVGSVSQSRTTFTGSGSAELAVYSTTSNGNPDWSTMDTNGGSGTKYDVVFLGDPTSGFKAGSLLGNADPTVYGGYDEDGSPVGSDELAGKIVMIARGTSSFFEKRDAAAAYGAAAVICYNHTPGDGVVSADLTGSTSDIPFGGLSYENGKAIFEICEKNSDGLYACEATVYGSLYINTGAEGARPTMSSFSSWGTTGALTIKPEITAPGGSIYSVNGGEGRPGDTSEYENMSGTSMASPHFSGMVALMQQYIRDNDNELLRKAQAAAGSGLTERQLAQSLLMSTAEPLMEGERPYSVRYQGAGLANVQKAAGADSFIMVDGQPDGKVKAELGDGTEPWSFTFTIYNLTDEAQEYVLSANLMSTGAYYDEDTGSYFSTNEMIGLGNGVSFSTGSTVTVAAGGSRTVTATVAVDTLTVYEMQRYGYTNGFYVEGYVYATPAGVFDYDLNGDKIVNAQDAQDLMDHIIRGTRLENAALADLDEDGRLTTRDVNLFLDLLRDGVGSIHSIPMLGWYGNWTDISMFDGDTFLDMYYQYLESGLDEIRLPHVFNFYEVPIIRNILMVSQNGADPDDPDAADWYSGNLYEDTQYGMYGDSRYIPARNALNNDGSGWWRPTWFSPMLMRNAIAARVQVTDSETGEAYYSKEYKEPFEGAYAHSQLGVLIDMSEYNVTPIGDYDFSNIPEGRDVTISFSYAPEYYENPDGTIRWDDLGSGATASFPFRIDNHGPDLVSASVSGSRLTVEVRDNNYIAFIAVLDGSGSMWADLPVCPDMDEDQRGRAITESFDISGLSGNKVLIALCDYAGNERFFSINLDGGSYAGGGYGDLVAFQSGFDMNTWSPYQNWVSFNADVDGNETSMFKSDAEFFSADYANGVVYAQDAQGWLYGIWYEDMVRGATGFESARIKRLDNAYQDMAYNYADGSLYGVRIDGGEDAVASYVDRIDLSGGCAVSQKFRLDGVAALGLACDDNGTFYLMGLEDGEGTAKLYTGTSVLAYSFDTELEMNYLQSMTWDHNRETLYWARCADSGWLPEADLWEIDAAERTCTQTGVLSGETCAMFAPLTDANAAKPAHSNVPSTPSGSNGTPVLVDTTLNLAVGGSRTLEYDIEPWYADNRDVTWRSSDTAVATVDQSGLVTAVGAGVCTIRVENANDPARYDVCTVNVVSLNLTVSGTYSEMGANIGESSDSYLYTFTMNGARTEMQQGPQINDPEATLWDNFGQKIGAAVQMEDGTLWTCEWGNMGMLRHVSSWRGMIDYTVQPVGDDTMWGLARSERTGFFTGISNNTLYIDLPDFYEWPTVYDWVPDEYDPELGISEEQFAFWHEMMYEYYDEENYNNYWHEIDLVRDLIASDKDFGTGEDGNGAVTDVVLCGITDIGSAGAVDLTRDYQGGRGASGSYTPDTTMVLLDNVGRLWYLDELTGMTKDGDSYTGACGAVSGSTGIHTWEYKDGTCSVFVIREIVDTPLTGMYWQGTMPRYTYHFSDIYYAGTADGSEVYLLSLYDYHNNGTTNQLYMLIMDENGGSTLIELGDTGDGNVIATIYDAWIDMSALPAASGYDGYSVDWDAAEGEVRPLAAGPYAYVG